MVVGVQTQAHAAALYSDNTSKDLTSEAVWYSSDSTVAVIDANGVITALKAGSTVISCQFFNTTEVTATTLTVSAAPLVSLQVNPGSALLAPGAQQQFSAVGEYGNGESYDVTALASWSSSDANKVSVSDSTGSKGLATALTAGTANITATFTSLSASAQATVSSASLTGVNISAPQTTIPTGVTLQLQATGIYSDNSDFDLTDLVSWSSSNESVATIDNTGLITSIAAGTVRLSLSYEGQTAFIDITVNSATLGSIEITPLTSNLIAGGSLQLFATAIYSDSSSLDVTDLTTWTSSDTAVATIGNTYLNRGLVSGVAAGSTNITAYFNGQNRQIALIVSSAVLQSIDITPSNASIAIGTQQKFTVIGQYDDGSTRDLSGEVTWSSSNNSIAELQSEAGYFKGISSGSTQIIAALDKTIAVTNLTVTNASLDSITLSPTNLEIAEGFSTLFTATGHFNDSSTQDISHSVTWQSSDAGVASISNAIADKGLLTAIASGSTNISASFSGISASTGVTVTNAQLNSISVQTNNSQMYAGTQQVLTATGHYSDGNTLDITTTVTWSSSNSAIASISNGNDDKGTVTGVSGGDITIAATFSGISGTADIHVIDDPNAPVSLSLSAAPNVILNDGSDTTTVSVTLRPAGNSGVIADGTSIDVVITEGGSPSNQIVTTTNGSANVLISSTYAGFIKIEATVTDSVIGTTISQSGHILSTTSFVNVIAKSVYKNTLYDSNTLLAGSWFALIVKNVSNRTFTVNQYQFSNGASSSVKPGNEISGGQLSGGELYGSVVQLNVDELDSGVSGVLSFTDPTTTQAFDITATFTSVP